MADIQFWRSNQLSDTSFLDLVKRTFGKTFTKGIDAKNWLIANGYYTSYPDIVTEGLVLYLDAANSDSFKGEPTTNLLTSYTENVGTNDYIGFKSNQGTEIKYVPSLGRVTVHYTNIYNDYPNNSASCCPSLYNFGDITISPNTVYTYQIVFRTSTNYYHPNYMYHYEFNNSTGLTEYGLLDGSRIKDLGNGWKHAWGTFTSQPTSNRFVCYLFHYEYSTQNKVEVAKISLTQGSTIYEPQFLLDVNGTRGTTYATGGGWCDLSGNNHNGTVGNNIFDKNNLGSIIFDGTASSTINLGIGTDFFPLYQFSLESWVKSSGLGTGMSIGGIFGFTYGLRYYINSDGSLTFSVNNSVGTSQSYVTSIGKNLFDNTWHHIICTNNGTTSYMYIDGILNNSIEAIWNGTTYWPTNSINIGRDNNDVYYHLNGKISSVKVYNKALSSSEVLQNYNATKEIFGL